jgi:hypothetical protein
VVFVEYLTKQKSNNGSSDGLGRGGGDLYTVYISRATMCTFPYSIDPLFNQEYVIGNNW